MVLCSSIQFTYLLGFPPLNRGKLTIAEKEGAHYDFDRQLSIDQLSDVRINDLSSEYQAIYYIATITLNLGYRLLNALATERYAKIIREIQLLDEQGNIDGEVTLSQSIDSLKWIQTLWSRNKFPENYSEVNFTLGNVYILLADFKDREDNLNLALSAFEQALTTFNEENYPKFCAKIEFSIGVALGKLSSDPEKLLARWNKAERIFRNIGETEEADLMLERISTVKRLSS